MIQFSVLSLALLGVPHLIAAVEVPESATLSVKLGLVGASLQVLTLLSMLLLYYRDLRREACVVAIAELVSIAVCASGACLFGPPPPPPSTPRSARSCPRCSRCGLCGAS